MSGANVPMYRGRILGIVVLVIAQFLIGTIHVSAGLLLLSAGPDVYSFYTLVFGMLVLFFAFALWLGRSWGWIGTIAISLFVTAVDSLALLNLPSIPGIPKTAAIFEIIYSLFVTVYLSQTHVRTKYKVSNEPK
jgi:hypothetical protein